MSFRSIYRALEKNFFQTLTRKLVGNFSFLLLLQLCLAVVVGFQLNKFLALVKDYADGTGLAEQLYAITDQLVWQASTVGGVLLLATVGTLIFLRFLVVGPIRKVNNQLREMNSDEADLSVRLTAVSYDEFHELVNNYNQFMENLCETILSLRGMGIQVAVGSAKVVGQVRGATGKATSQGELSSLVFSKSQSATEALEGINSNTRHVASSTSQNLESARSAFGELQSINDKMATMLDQIQNHDRTIKQMGERSRGIRKIISIIQEISFQTGLLSLNAAIEAARAGQAGKGFSVVAGEVKKLAEQANHSSEQIADEITGMLQNIDLALQEAQDISGFATQTMGVSQMASSNYAKLIQEFDANNSLLAQISTAVQEISESNQQVHQNVSNIQELSSTVVDSTTTAATEAGSLQQTSERLQQEVARFVTGKGPFEQVLGLATEFRDTAEQLIGNLLRDGHNVFDTNYREIPGTDPVKYQTCYDQQFEFQLQPLYDRILGLVPEGVFALCVDVNGYGPTHNSIYAKPITGNHQKDLIGSRDKRIFNDPTGLRSARNTEHFLLQTYVRDTGEILSDLSMPIHIDGRHWGAIRIAFNPMTLLN